VWTEADGIPAWETDPALLSPLFLAYDKRIAEADQVNDRMKRELISLHARVKQISSDNERLVSEVKELTELAINKMEMQDSGQSKGRCKRKCCAQKYAQCCSKTRTATFT
jgi:hypothetical protein